MASKNKITLEVQKRLGEEKDDNLKPEHFDFELKKHLKEVKKNETN